ncbi:methyltransferase [Lentzea sp. NPDC058436]|uniref:methyltransferase n=1 Tax=Lentzea sp. NPDC058436 TaxID=3346499 RepID=UPI00364D85F2
MTTSTPRRRETNDQARHAASEELMLITAGFWSFKTLAAAVDLGLFALLRDGRCLNRAEVAAELGIPDRPADMLLAACASLGLLRRERDGYTNDDLAEDLLVPGRRRYFGDFVLYADRREYPAWLSLGEALRTDRPQTWNPDEQETGYAVEDEVMTALFWNAMHSLSSSTAEALADAVDLGGHRRLLDVGGGSGAYSLELCRRNPELMATVYELPHVCEQTAGRIAEASLEHRVDAVAGDFRAPGAALPAGHDVMLLSMVLHCFDEAACRDLLRKCRQAIEPGGTILISELLLDEDRGGPPLAALMGMNMVVESQGGRNHSELDYRTWLWDAGFEDAEVVRFRGAGANGVVVARAGARP